jgi:hypothetical protein
MCGSYHLSYAPTLILIHHSLGDGFSQKKCRTFDVLVDDSSIMLLYDQGHQPGGRYILTWASDSEPLYRPSPLTRLYSAQSNNPPVVDLAQPISLSIPTPTALRPLPPPPTLKRMTMASICTAPLLQS